MTGIRRPVLLGSALLLLLPAQAIAAPSADAPTVGSNFTWEGSWESNWGMMTLTGDASGMEGSYTYDDGRIWADVVPGAGALYRGMWSEYPSYQGPGDAGYIEFRVSADGRTFDGDWNYTNSEGWVGEWYAVCVGGPCLGNSTDPLTPVPAVVPETGKVLGPSQVRKGRKATFRFSASDPAATFQYKVDGKKWRATSAPKVKISTKSLRPGKHKIRVRAVLGGEVDRTPSLKRFKVRR